MDGNVSANKNVDDSTYEGKCDQEEAASHSEVDNGCESKKQREVLSEAKNKGVNATEETSAITGRKRDVNSVRLFIYVYTVTNRTDIEPVNMQNSTRTTDENNRVSKEVYSVLRKENAVVVADSNTGVDITLIFVAGIIDDVVAL